MATRSFTLLRRIAPAASAASLAAAHNTATRAQSSETKSQRVAAERVNTLTTSDGTPYTLEYLDRSRRFSVWTRSGKRSSFSEMLAAAADHDVIFLGETHYDAVAHKVQEITLTRLAAMRPAVALSLEMFATEVQQVLNEYLGGHIREQDLLDDAHPWQNYAQHYRPMVEFAKAAGLPVVAANAPRRYVSAVGRGGEDVLTRDDWGARAYADLPPLPLPVPSDVYMANLHADPEVVPRKLAGGGGGAPMAGGGKGGVGVCPHIGLTRSMGLVAPMKLWDATMAHSIAKCLAADPSRLVVHVCGSDHCKHFNGARVGILEWLAHYRPDTRSLVIVTIPESDCHTFVPSHHAGIADFIVLTDDLSAEPPPSPTPPPPPPSPLPPPPSPPPSTPATPLIATPPAAKITSGPRVRRIEGTAAEIAEYRAARMAQYGATSPPASNSLSRALVCLGEAAKWAAASALLAGGATYGAIHAAEQSSAFLALRRWLGRRGKVGTSMGLGLAAACVGAKLGVGEAISQMEADAADAHRTRDREM